MTDDRLIELVEQRTPQELSGAELAEIRTRLADSPALRAAIMRHLQLEQALHQTVGQFRLPLELLLAKAAAIHATSTVAKVFGWGSVGTLLIGMATVGTLVALRGAPPPAIERVALDEPESPSDAAPGEQAGAAAAGGRETAGLDPGAARHPFGPARPTRQPTELYFADDEEAAAWRQSLESFTGGVSQRRVGNRTELVLHGSQQLKSNSTWPAAGRMRMTLADHDRFKIHLSSSAEAPIDLPRGAASPPSCLTLEFFARPQPLWVAWLAARRANQTLPETLALAAHDGGITSGLSAATIDVGYHRGEIVLTHGDTEILAAPLAGPPDRIVFEGNAVVRGLGFAEGLVSVAQRDNSALEADDEPRPAERDWKCELPTGSTWSTLSEGRVELFAEDSQTDARAAYALGDVPVHEIHVQLEEPLPGTGIYLADERGDIRYRLSFVPGRKANQVCFAPTADNAPPALPDGPLPLCSTRPCFRLLAADGLVKAWFSCDGIHWSPALGPDQRLDSGIVTAGVYCLAGPGTRSIRLTRFAAVGTERQPDPPGELFGRVRRRSGESWPFLFARHVSASRW